MNIVFKVICVLLALALIPVMLFTPLFRIVFSVGGEYPTYVESSVYTFLKPSQMELGSNSLLKEVLSSEAALQFKPAAISFAVFFAITALLAVAIIFLSVFSRKKGMVSIFSGLSILSLIGAALSFRSISRPIVTGLVPLSDFLKGSALGDMLMTGNLSSSLGFGKLGEMLGGLLNFSAVDIVLNVDSFVIGTAYYLSLFISIALLAWSLAFVLVEWGEESKKRKSR